MFFSVHRGRKCARGGMTCGYGWVRFKLTASTSWASYTQTILFSLLNLCCWKHCNPPPSPPILIFLAVSVCTALLLYNDIWQSVVIALPHIERTILVFQRRTLLNPLPHINLSRVLFLAARSHVLRLWLICLCPGVIKSRKSFSLPTFNSSHLIIFERLFGHWA